jgi:hypothetical protein
MTQQTVSYSQLVKKLQRACTGTDLGDDEVIRALIEVMVGAMTMTTGAGGGGWPRLRRIARTAIFAIIDGVTDDLDEATALCGALSRWASILAPGVKVNRRLADSHALAPKWQWACLGNLGDDETNRALGRSRDLVGKLYATAEIGLSDEDIVRALAETLVARMMLATVGAADWRLRVRQTAVAALYDIVDGATADADEMKALGAELARFAPPGAEGHQPIAEQENADE